MKSNLQGGDPSLFGSFVGLLMKIQPTHPLLRGALTTLYCATRAEATREGPGRYFVPVGKVQRRWDKWVEDREGNRELWEWSEEVMRRLG